MALGDLLVSYADTGLDSNAGEHGDKCVDAEHINLASSEITDSWLSNTESVSSFFLSQTGSSYLFGEFDHECGADAEILGLFLDKAQITKNIF